MFAFNLWYNPALNSASVHRGVLLNDSNCHIYKALAWLWLKNEYCTWFIAVLRKSEDYVLKCWVICQTQFRAATIHCCSQNLAGRFTVIKRGCNAGSSPISLPVCFTSLPSLPSFLLVSSLGWRFLWTIVWRLQTCHIFPPKAVVPHSYINIRICSICCPCRGAFMPAKKLTLATTGTQKTMHVCGLYQGNFSSSQQFWLKWCPSTIMFKLHANPYLFFFCRIPIYSKM